MSDPALKEAVACKAVEKQFLFHVANSVFSVVFQRFTVDTFDEL